MVKLAHNREEFEKLRVMPYILDCRFKFGIRRHTTLHDTTQLKKQNYIRVSAFQMSYDRIAVLTLI